MEVSQEQVIKFLREKGKRGAQTLSVLGKYAPFMAAIQSEIGVELLRDLNTMHDELLDKISSLTATESERAEYKAVKGLILRFCDKLNKYENELNKIKEG
uniref:Uncharacterized protein n=1 Tax=viral metagenome TaxID=1070528 RepID=A0A6M3IS91_9ZZZZ